MSLEKNRILGFDGVRALAVLSIVLAHYNVFTVLLQKNLLHQQIHRLIFSHTGVQAFCVLTGFLITMRLIQEYERYQTISFKKFFMRRALRVGPLYFFMLALLTILHILNVTHTSGKSLVFAYACVYNFIPKDWYAMVLGHTWSLLTGFHFYLIWPFLFIALFPKRRRLFMLLCCVYFIFACVAYNALLMSEWMNRHFFIERWTVIIIYNFLVGAFLALLLTGEKRSVFWSNLLSRKTMFFVGFLFANTYVLFDVSFKIWPFLRSIGIGFMLMWIYFNQKSILVRVLEGAWFTYIGRASYSFFIWHGFFISTGPFRASGELWPPSQHIGFIMLLFTAPLSYHYLEKSFLNKRAAYLR